MRQVTAVELPTRWGKFHLLGFERDTWRAGQLHRETALALVTGDVWKKPPLVRIHSQCLTGEVFGSLRCDCGEQLWLALDMLRREGAGILIYEQQEGRGIGLITKLQTYELQDRGLDTVEANEGLGLKADYRDFTLPVEMLKQLGVGRVRLLSNNPDKVAAVRRAGIEVVERVACEGTPNAHSAGYLRTKRQKLGHALERTMPKRRTGGPSDR